MAIVMIGCENAQAQSPSDDAVALAYSLAANEKARDGVVLRNDAYPNRHIQNLLLDRLLDRNDENVETLFETARKAGLADLDLFLAYYQLEKLDEKDVETSPAYQTLLSASKDKNWYRANRALVFLALYHATQKDSLPAIRYANSALKTIPIDDNSLKAGDARYDTYDVLNTVFIYDRNLTKALDAAKNMVKYGLAAKRDIDSVGVIYNLSVLFSYAHEYKTATKLGEILVEMTTNHSDYKKALAQLALGKNLALQGKYKKSVGRFEKASLLAPNSNISYSSQAQLALVYAKVGRVKDAKKYITATENFLATSASLKGSLHPILNRARATLAKNTGDYKSAFKFQELWAQAKISKLEKLAFEDRRKASDQLALSEKLAQTEFESMMAKANLQSKIIVQERRVRNALAALLVALLSIIFMLYNARKKQILVNEQLEIAAKQAKAGEEAKARFLAVMSHELRTPMNPIIALSHILKKRITNPSDAKLLALINLSAEGLMDMIENLMVATENPDAEKSQYSETVDIRRFATDIVKRFFEEASNKGISFRFFYNPKLPTHIQVHKTAFKILLTNVLSNAVKFTEDGEVTTLITLDPKNENTLLVRVQDTGVGLDMTELPNLVKAFEQRDSSFTRKFGGTGIGLYVATSKAKQIGAKLDIQSEIGVGTQIEIRLPINSPPLLLKDVDPNQDPSHDEAQDAQHAA